MEHFDLIVIGSGAGLILADAAQTAGKTCAVIEEKDFGGTCLNRGCIPSKMLVYPADTLRQLAHARRAGIHIEGARVDWALLRARILERTGQSRDIKTYYESQKGVSVFHGHAAFLDEKTVRVTLPGGETKDVAGNDIVIAVGARSKVPDIPGLKEAGFLTYESFFGNLPLTPFRSLAILGSGIIAAEFAHIFSALGASVTLIGRSGRLLKNEDGEVSGFIEKNMRARGIDLKLTHRLVKAEKTGGGKRLTVMNAETGDTEHIECEELLIAAGVTGNADRLTAEKAGLSPSPDGYLSVDKRMRTSVPHVYALGDATGKYMFRHTANKEAFLLARNLFGNEPPEEMRYESTPWAVFTLHQVGHVGKTEEEVRLLGIPYRVGRKKLSSVAMGWAMEYNEGDADDGFVKILTDKDDRILGAHAVGYQAAALVQPFAYLMETGGGTLKPLRAGQPIHPSINELAAWAADEMQTVDVP